ncbi:MAG: M15 family metallopeptidase [Mesorhizobium sp.]|nr:M15 family peptidase [bacterium M00.F.Ca.ET.205.01.1.1]TGU53875.1 M15 family peptidase [bacterium M00.F.Ca.ET.152.01.1.1]TGV37373.1 M15 family peptidase [Mesorhizobium sp. M00.F.Ca.ET.186.01.1.1]TGZ41267.1 M15 family peptidase [bacterium M00.F.Ca.ET.162.01.1.1]TIW62262.1 MAG: M15 family metallopeptidase [Mesorhizobium sp.]
MTMIDHPGHLLPRLLIVLAVCSAACVAHAGDGVDQPAAKAALLKAYPGRFTISGNILTWTDGTTMVWDDGKTRDAEALLETPDIEDMFHFVYPPASAGDLVPAEDFDPGRIRNEAFFEKLYGASAGEVGKHIANVKWLPKLGKKTVQVTKVFGIDDRLRKVSDALEAMPAQLSRYGLKPGGGFVWRPIAGTHRLSVHSFGAAFDINVGFSDYWYNNRDNSHPNAHIPFKNRIPLQIVELFEKNGFIWGGRWYHYDTMHFEYRPELLLYKKSG